MPFISAYIFQAYLTCPREAWLEYHSIGSDQDHEYLALGRLVHETAYRRFRKEIFVDQLLKIDLLRGKFVAEVKRSSKHKEAARLQLAFYLFYLKQEKGLNLEGVLLFPKERKTERIVLSPELEHKVETMLRQMKSVLATDQPPPPVKTRYCSSCSFCELCWG